MSAPVYYEYFPRFFRDRFHEVYAEVKDKCTRYRTESNGRSYTSPRASCVFSDLEGDSTYGNLTTYEWKKAPTILKIREKLEEKLGCAFDYVLAHIYETGKSSIAWHQDREALDSTIASVSFGAARKFRLRKMGEHHWEKEFRLVSGDLVVMWGPGEKNELGCQRVYKHCVPKESTVQFLRINLTFR